MRMMDMTLHVNGNDLSYDDETSTARNNCKVWKLPQTSFSEARKMEGASGLGAQREMANPSRRGVKGKNIWQFTNQIDVRQIQWFIQPETAD